MIIALAGRKQHGKTSVTNYLINTHDFIEYSWAHPLKEFIGRGILGLNDDQLYGNKKEEVDLEWGMSPRKMLQLIGSDFLRDKFNPNIWVKAGMRKIAKDKKVGNLCVSSSFVFSDCRFPNELNSLYNYSKKEGTKFASILVLREGYDSDDEHSSENSLANYPFDYKISAKGGDLEALYAQMEGILNAVRKN
jgi:hypothetical protein